MAVSSLIRRQAAGTMVPGSRGRWTAALYQGARMAYRGYKRYRSSRNSNKDNSDGRSDGINTFQDQSDRLYTKRRVPRRKVRKAKRWNRAVVKVINRSLSDRNFLRQSTAALTAAAGQQNAFSFSLNGCAGSLGQNDDLSVIIGNITPSASTFTQKYQLKSAVMDLTITASNANSAVSFLDFYFVVSRKDAAAAFAQSHASVLVTGFTDMTGGGSVTYQDYGVTPFQNPQFCQYFLITKVQRVQLGPGQTCSIMDKYNRLRILNTEDIDGALCFRKGISRGILCIWSGGPSLTGAASASTLQINCTRTYQLNTLQNSDATYKLL